MNRIGELAPNVFVSYAHVDKPFAHRLAAALEERGCRSWVDEFELRAGDSLTERIAAALTTADFVVLLVSSASVASNWCRRELQMALSTSLSEGRTIVLPVRLGSVVMPPALSDIVYVVADREDPDASADRLVVDMLLHAAEVEQKRPATVNEREWEFALQPAHELDDLLGELESEMSSFASGRASRSGPTTYGSAWRRWNELLDKWTGAGRLPSVLSDLAWRLEGLLEVATRHDAAYRRNKGIRRRLKRIVLFAIIETRHLMTEAMQHPEYALHVIEDCSIPEREELMALIATDPQLFTLRDLVVPPEAPDDAGESEPPGESDQTTPAARGTSEVERRRFREPARRLLGKRNVGVGGHPFQEVGRLV